MTDVKSLPAARDHYRGPKTGLAYLKLLQRDAPAQLLRERAAYGDVVPIKLPFRSTSFLLSDPELIEQVLVRENAHMIKGLLVRELKHIFGNGLLVSEHDTWRRNRKLASPPFTKRAIASYADGMTRIAGKYVQMLTPGVSRNIHRDMMAITLEVVVESLFGSELPPGAEHIGASLDLMMAYFESHTRSLKRHIPRWLPTPANLRVKRAVRQIDATVHAIIEKKRAELTNDANDLLSLLLRARDDDGSGFTDQQLRDEAVTIFIAGHETTALTLSYALMLLALHPDMLAKAHGEIDDVLGDRPANVVDIPRLAFLDSVIAETLRLYPPAWMIARELTQTIAMNGMRYDAGEQFWLSPWTVHHDPRWFPEPESFAPERWTEDFKSSLPRFAYFPFGGGPRICIGNHFATMEAVLVLATILQKRTFTLAPDHHLAFEISMTLRPRDGIRVIPAERHRSGRAPIAAGCKT